jgi:hypothetical protein
MTVVHDIIGHRFFLLVYANYHLNQNGNKRPSLEYRAVLATLRSKRERIIQSSRSLSASPRKLATNQLVESLQMHFFFALSLSLTYTHVPRTFSLSLTHTHSSVQCTLKSTRNLYAKAVRRTTAVTAVH